MIPFHFKDGRKISIVKIINVLSKLIQRQHKHKHKHGLAAVASSSSESSVLSSCFIVHQNAAAFEHPFWRKFSMAWKTVPNYSQIWMFRKWLLFHRNARIKWDGFKLVGAIHLNGKLYCCNNFLVWEIISLKFTS